MVSLLIMFCLSACQVEASPGTPPIDALVRIEANVNNSWRIVGSGVHTKLGVRTARHVAEISEEYPLRACMSTECKPLETYITRQGSDLKDHAVYEVWFDDQPTVKLRTRVLPPGEPVWLIGYPRGQFWLAHGTVVSHKNDIIYIDGYAAPGSSGGMVIDSRGRLAGTIVAINVHSNPYIPFIPEQDNQQVIATSDFLVVK